MKLETKLLIGGFGCILIASALYVVVVKIPADLAANVSQGLRETLNFTPQVRISETVVIEQTTSIVEVATVSRDLSVDYSWSHQWLGSTKTIALQGMFTAKAGFDLKEKFTVDIKRYPLNVTASMPAPKILSLQLNEYRVRQDESGWWNRISTEDREHAMRALQHSAREKAQNSGLLTEARSTVEQRIKEVVERNGAIVEFKYPRSEEK